MLVHQSLDCFVVVVYAVASLTLCSLYLCLCCDGMFCEDFLFSCCESVVTEVDYCVCDVRLLSSLVCGVLAGSRLGEFLTNWHDQLKTIDQLT